MNLENYLREEMIVLDEAAYPGNIGFVEMVEFYQKATEQQIKQMEKIIKRNDFIGFANMIKKTIGVELKK
jgi:hypothetical protein